MDTTTEISDINNMSEKIKYLCDFENTAEISENFEEYKNGDLCDFLTLNTNTLSPKTAESIAWWLVSKYRSKIIFSYIDEIFGELSSSDRSAVYSSVCSIISGKHGLEHLEYIKSKIIDFFSGEKTMNIDGFLNFRLRGYKDDIKSLVEECGNDIIAYHDMEDMIDIINFLFDTTTTEYD